MAINYVKFMRGSQALYNNLETKDKDTLYFVYENITDEYGKLYLGNKLIAGGSNSDPVSLANISDIIINENLSDGNILIYDEAEDKWVNGTFADIVNVPIMSGASATADGTSGLVPVPVIGDQFYYLRGDGVWAPVEAELSPQDKENIDNLQEKVDTLIGDDAEKSVREIAAQEIAAQLIPANASESLDTLQEIAAWIQDHPSDASAMAQEISELKNIIIENGGLNDRVASLENTVGNFVPVEDKYMDINSAINYFNIQLENIDNRLRWQEIEASPALVDDAIVDKSSLSE